METFSKCFLTDSGSFLLFSLSKSDTNKDMNTLESCFIVETKEAILMERETDRQTLKMAYHESLSAIMWSVVHLPTQKMWKRTTQ